MPVDGRRLDRARRRLSFAVGGLQLTDQGGVVLGGELVGTVMSARSRCVSLLLAEPSPGTAFLTAEGYGPSAGVSVWLYLYGDDAPRVAEANQEAWATWLAEAAP